MKSVDGAPQWPRRPVELTRLHSVDDRLQVGRPNAVDALGVDHGSVGEDLEEHAEAAAIVGAPQREPRQDGSARGDRGAHARARGQPLRGPGAAGQSAASGAARRR